MATIQLRNKAFQGPGFTEATILPERGMMLLNARLRLPNGEVVDGMPGERDGAFPTGGALLIPYANRMPGHAIHGYVRDLPADWSQPSPDRIDGVIDAGDFGGRWPSRTRVDVTWTLAGGALALSVRAENVGDEVLPIAIGWHPYLAIPSGDRRQALLKLDATRRVEVDGDLLPTGRRLPTRGTAYDFAEGAPLGDLALDDCFLDHSGAVELQDPQSGVGLRITCPGVKAIQLYAPRDATSVAVEPQFNVADPFGAVWAKGFDTGMVRLRPGEKTTYDVRVSAFALGT